MSLSNTHMLHITYIYTHICSTTTKQESQCSRVLVVEQEFVIMDIIAKHRLSLTTNIIKCSCLVHSTNNRATATCSQYVCMCILVSAYIFTQD